jgi:phospholipase D3/4
MNDLTPAGRASLVESIPVGLEDLRGTAGVQYTEDVLTRLTRAAQSTIDLTAMYWALLPDPTEGGDEEGFTQAQLDSMGAGEGRALFEALREAAGRGVSIRILKSPGFSHHNRESDALQQKFPEKVTIHTVEMGEWYGGNGIMHQKIWIFDARHIYLGSANMDWKSITQVKELGISVEDSPELAADATKYFNTWWAFSALTPASVQVFDPVVRINRMVPPWSTLVDPLHRAGSPLDGYEFATAFSRTNPLPLTLNGEHGGVFLTGSPSEVRGRGRTWDGDGLVHTIDDARRSICLSVMDFGPIGLYRHQSPEAAIAAGIFPDSTPVWWPSLFDALLSAALTRHVNVRLLVSKWAHTSGLIEPLLVALQKAADAGRADSDISSGELEIRRFIVPGWDSTTGEHRKYPGHSRVNHTKYIVTDRRINVGTSNMTWDYFASTAGSSLNSNHPSLIRTLQAVFDRDWASSYASRVVSQ